MIKLVLFDLDGTLLPMNQELFTQNYMGALANFAFPNDEEKRKRIIKAVWYGVSAIVKNDGSKTNEDAFWQAFGTVSEDGIRSLYGKNLHLSASKIDLLADCRTINHSQLGDNLFLQCP